MLPNKPISPARGAWCHQGGAGLVQLLGETFGKENVLVRSPHHVQVRYDGAKHNVWIDAGNFVKYLLANQAGRAQVAPNAAHLLRAIAGHDETQSDLANMRQALELTALIDAAKAALPLCGLSRAVFVDAGMKENKAQIAFVRISRDSGGEYVMAESRPVVATNSNEAERAAIEFALTKANDELIFCDNRSVVEQCREKYGDRIRWLPRDHNKLADQVANVRGKRGKRRRKRKPKAR